MKTRERVHFLLMGFTFGVWLGLIAMQIAVGHDGLKQLEPAPTILAVGCLAGMVGLFLTTPTDPPRFGTR